MMRPIPIPVGSDPGPFDSIGGPKVVNAYAEVGGNKNKSNFSLLPVNGIKPFGGDNGAGCRGLMYLEDEGILYAIQGSQLFRYDETGAATALGFIAGNAPAFLARNDANPQDVVIIAADRAYTIREGKLEQQRYTSVTVDDDGTETTNVLPFIGVTYVGGYFVFWLKDGRFFVSDLQSTNVRDIQFATAEGDPDGLVAAIGTANTLYLMGPDTTEVWAITGADFPLLRVNGAEIRFGTRSPHSLSQFDTGVMVVGDDNVVYRIDGLNFEAVSSNEVTRLIEAEVNKEDIIAFTHERGKHKFYTLQGTGWTREYNSATGEWHDREDELGRPWHIVFQEKAWNRDIFGDRVTGQLFEGDYSIFTDDGRNTPWGFDTQVVHDSPNGVSFDRVELDVETGDGISVAEAGEVMLRWSKDNGRTFSERRLSLGKTGEYKKRVRTGSIGQCNTKGMIIGVRITDPVVRAITGLYADMEEVDL